MDRNGRSSSLILKCNALVAYMIPGVLIFYTMQHGSPESGFNFLSYMHNIGTVLIIPYDKFYERVAH